MCGAVAIEAVDERDSPIKSGNDLFGFIADDDFGSGTGDAEHFGESATAVAEEVDSADVEDEVKGIVSKGKALGFSLVERGVAMLAAEIAAAGAQHSHGKINAVDLSVEGQEAEVGSGADGDFEDSHVGAELEFGGEEGSNVTLDDSLVGFLGEIIERSDAVIHSLILAVERLRSGRKDGDAFLNGVAGLGGME